MKLGSTSFNPLNPFDWWWLGRTAPSRVNDAYNSPYSVEAAQANAKRDILAYGRKKARYEAMTSALDTKQQANFAVQDYKKAKKNPTRKSNISLTKNQVITEARQKSSESISGAIPPRFAVPQSAFSGF